MLKINVTSLYYIFAGIVESMFLKKPPSLQWVIATFLSIIGCSILFFNKELVVFSSVGVIFTIGAGIFFALYTLTNKTIVEQHGVNNIIKNIRVYKKCNHIILYKIKHKLFNIG